MTGEAIGIERTRHIAQRLLASSRFRQTSSAQGFQTAEEAAWELATSLADIEEASKRYVNDLMPRLVAADVAEEELADLLHAIGEELRHVLYHVRDARYFGYLQDEVPEANAS
jgi:Zn-dependent oligopeptidase